MTATFSGLLAVLLYALGTFSQGRTLSADIPSRTLSRSNLLGIALLALGIHLVSVLNVIITGNGYDFGFFKIATLFSWAMVLITVLSSVRKPVENLFVVVFPVAIVSILCSLFLPSQFDPLQSLAPGVVLHIILGILGFSLITIAAAQAALVTWLSKELKQHHFSPVLRHLPPLQTMESLLFEIIRAGFLVLLAVIVSGFVFMEDMFAQHLVHKTFFTILATCVFGILLWGRHQKGWRGKTALYWTLGGFIFLIMAYFGAKFVLELLLNRV